MWTELVERFRVSLNWMVRSSRKPFRVVFQSVEICGFGEGLIQGLTDRSRVLLK